MYHGIKEQYKVPSSLNMTRVRQYITKCDESPNNNH